MRVEEVIQQLSPMERSVVPYLRTGITVPELAAEAGVEEVAAMRACQFLSNKGVLDVEYEEYDVHALTPTGRDVLERGLPEQRFLDALETPKSMNDLRREADLQGEEVNAAIGILKNAGAIEMGAEIKKKKDVSFADKITALKHVEQGLPGAVSEEFVKRGLVERTRKNKISIQLTALGQQLTKADLSSEYIEKLTHEMLKDGSYKDAKLRHYDVTSPIPARGYGRQHYVQDAISFIKQLWIEMGFTEMEGNMVQTAFWDLDALFVPQDHPAREMQDTFYLPEPGKLPEWWEDIKDVHEHGGDTGSLGWQTVYSEDEAKNVLLRTHTTVLSAQTLKKLDPEDLPARFFSVAKVFRNETLDWKHLFEFHQVEGIVVGEGLTLADLIGLQKQFYKKMGFEKIRFRPGYFPYTEPSAEVEVFHPERKEWVELGGMGVFRPEFVKPLLGKDVPVLAWGLGMERIITDYYGIKDLRDIYTHDLSKLKNMKKFLMEER